MRIGAYQFRVTDLDFPPLGFGEQGRKEISDLLIKA